jgi:hypothetical protein
MADFDMIGYLRGKVPDKMLKPREVSMEEEEIILALVEGNLKNSKRSTANYEQGTATTH